MLKRLTQKPNAAVRTVMPPPSSETWSLPRPSALREAAIESSIFGIAIGESFGLRFEGLPPINLEKNHYFVKDSKFPTRHGLCTHAAISSGQALLECRSSASQFAMYFRRRLTAHMAGRLPLAAIQGLIPSAREASLNRSGKLGRVDRLAPTIIFMSAILQGATNRISSWTAAVYEAAGVTISPELEIYAFGKLLARAAQYAAFEQSPSELLSEEPLKWLQEGTKEPTVEPWLEAMSNCLERQASPLELQKDVSDLLEEQIESGDPRLEICIAIYIWLLHPTDWKEGIALAASLGGRASSRCATYSALASLATGGDCLPVEIVKSHRWAPISIDWLDYFITRLLQWPHGEDDLVAAHGMRPPTFGMMVAHQTLGARMIYRQILNFSSSLFRRK